MRVGQQFNMIGPFCKKAKTFTVTEYRGSDRWDGQAPSCVQNGNMMVLVNAKGKQEWPLGPSMARAMGRYIKKHDPSWGLAKAAEWFMGACTMPPTKQNLEDYKKAYRE